ncbi:MAG: hypothetical protein QOG53_1644 [Frankiales bacterium]|nr:hypothetical protein [Frankiales bacterium]
MPPNPPKQPTPQPPNRRARRTRRGGRRRLRRVEETSAGGLVVDRTQSSASAALIGRYDRRGRLRWSLPKGHLEPGETAEQAAVREVAEETGIRGRVLAPLGVIDFSFVAPDEDGPRQIHKTVHHFLLLAEGGELSDADGEVAEVAWVPLDEIEHRLTFDDERQLVDTARRLLAGTA